ncbi:MAG: DUF2922 domain-containing protein [Clostridiales bacterium]|jgi:hypothetical protein|nr:DUF2922 domain-containing protein [Clostridiales bacterium]
MTKSSRFVLTFNSNLGKIVRLSIPRANESKTTVNAETAMNAIIANGTVVKAGKGFPVSIDGAKVVTTERKAII